MTSAVDSQSDPQSNSLSPTLSPNAPDCGPILPPTQCLPSPPPSDAVEMPPPAHAESLHYSTSQQPEPTVVEDANAGFRKRKLPAEKEGNSLRRSPRFSSGSGSGSRHLVKRHGSRGPELPLNVQNVYGKFNGGEHLRRCPGLNPSEKLDVKLDGTLELRRSPRFSSSKGNENMEINVLQRKRTSKAVHQTKNNIKAVSTSVELSSSTVEQHSEVKIMSRSLTYGIDDTKSLNWSSEAISSPYQNGRTISNSFPLSQLDDDPPRKKYRTSNSSTKEGMDSESIAAFIGDPIPEDEAQKRWGWRYELKDKKCKDQQLKINEGEEDEIIANVKCHYAQAEVGNCVFSLGDCAFIEGEGEEKHVGRIIEFFQTTEGQNYFRVQWFYRIQDTVVQDEGGFHDKRRVFYSSIMNDNLIDCIIGKANVTQITPRVGLKLASISPSDLYYDMEYCVDYSTFRNIPTDASAVTESLPSSELCKNELSLLDLYSGCGGMSTGLCLGAKTASVNLVTRWAVDSDMSASESLKLNHPDTHVRNESAEDFLELLKEWEKLCKRYNATVAERKLPCRSNYSETKKQEVHDVSDDEFEVSKLVDICFGDPKETGNRGLYFKVHWKGCSTSEDTWEPIKSLSKCKESIQDFVRKGMKSKILPLPGEVDVICGGPPCQGISGYNRYRNSESPLDDERNRQIVIFMDMVKFLKPRHVLMENVVDILRFDKGSLGRYALSRLVHMKYQARLGIIAAGCYGLPQFRLRVFLWGSHPSEVLPQFPLPTHDVIVRYWPPPEFERNVVAYDENQPRELEKATVIQDAISDLPAVMNTETREQMPYQSPPETEFQRYIRSTKYVDMTGSKSNETTKKMPLLYDHRPHTLSEDSYQRVCQIPKRKGANFRDLPGVVVGADNVVRRHPTDNPMLPSGKPLIPDFCFTFEGGKSKRPYARLWWDENLPTALTFPSCHNQVVLHPEQDRVLTIREYARLQGFPDYYKFHGSVKRRYRQIGNAVAVSVSRALGYTLGLACRKLSGNEPLVALPPKFSHSHYLQLSNNQPCNTDNTD
ncbi:DNA (cytosine-5)-methyltransferase CMT2 isoform X3 [Vigna radiata var. radiata]|uniref:Cytosine-specific methyltransferase n=1 Tax=Vigna radiata var. radiata TaxID=3916 RepID=A0A3Q0F3T0_VIGRR|nr:DNA (cytosine-5)-methyltransferase CMT2 isoform X3 [Vigna radiata var. radiata]